MVYVGIILYLGLSYLIAAKIGRYKTIGFWMTFLLCIIVSPFIGYLVAEGGGMKNPRGCKWCGNKYNEVEFCGLCGKNEQGEMKVGFVNKNK